MAIYDLIPYKIRVLINSAYFDGPEKGLPLDIEGTCISINTHGSAYNDKRFKAGKILELVFEQEDELTVNVRWDNDTKSRVHTGSLIHRSSNVSNCVSIWKAYPKQSFPSDTRPYHVLHPQTWKPHMRSLRQTFTFVDPAPKVIHPEIFRSIDDVPMGHPNAVIKTGNQLLRVHKRNTLDGRTKIQTEVVSGGTSLGINRKPATWKTTSKPPKHRKDTYARMANSWHERIDPPEEHYVNEPGIGITVNHEATPQGYVTSTSIPPTVAPSKRKPKSENHKFVETLRADAKKILEGGQLTGPKGGFFDEF